LELGQESRLDTLRREGGGQLDGARRIPEVLHRLDAGDVIKEPATTGLHQEGVPLHLQELQRRCPLLCRERSAGVLHQVCLDVACAAIQYQVDVAVPRGPDIGEISVPLFHENTMDLLP